MAQPRNERRTVSLMNIKWLFLGDFKLGFLKLFQPFVKTDFEIWSKGSILLNMFSSNNNILAKKNRKTKE